MKNASILIATSMDATTRELSKTLEAIRAIPARAVVAVVGDMPVFPYYAVGVAPYGMADFPPEWQENVAVRKEALKAKGDEIEQLLQKHDVSGEVCTIACELAYVAENVARRAMLCDMAFITSDLRESDALFQQVANGVLFQSPIGVVVNDFGAEALSAPKRVFVAWDTDMHAARAVHQALPLLRQADEVTLGCIDPVMTEYRDGEDPGADAAKWLTHHGCNVTVQQYPSGGLSIGESLLERAKDSGADLIVMGAYGHSRIRNLIIGSTTTAMVQSCHVPVLLFR